MTPHDPIKAAAEELNGLNDTLRVITNLTRDAERKLGEAEAEFTALNKSRGMIAIMVERQQQKLIALRTAAEQEGKT